MVNSLKSDFKKDVLFLEARLDTDDGKAFANIQRASRVTLIFFKPDGTKITTLIGVRPEENLRRIIPRIFRLRGYNDNIKPPDLIKNPNQDLKPQTNNSNDDKKQL
ncbi:MAG: hypothetical protein OEY59_05020 [Deltaproteobacteria bacterium]|nr:hypothetical protein [Deltaproteobacteria bacterium]